MVGAIQITCINKDPRFDPYHRITHVGRTVGVNPWRRPVDDVIRMIEAGGHFFVQPPFGHPINVIVAVSASGRKYLKTEADGATPNNLLSLPECT